MYLTPMGNEHVQLFPPVSHKKFCTSEGGVATSCRQYCSILLSHRRVAWLSVMHRGHLATSKMAATVAQRVIIIIYSRPRPRAQHRACRCDSPPVHPPASRSWQFSACEHGGGYSQAPPCMLSSWNSYLNYYQQWVKYFTITSSGCRRAGSAIHHYLQAVKCKHLLDGHV